MRKLISILLVVLMLVTAIACDPESGTVNDVTFNVSVNLKNVGEDKKESVAYVGDVTWKYTAIKGDDGYTTGETTEEKELGDGNLGKLSLGSWTITLFGYEDNKVTYTGFVKTGSIVADTNVAVSVEKISKDAKVAFYSDFTEAVQKANAGDTITLVKDVTIGSAEERADAIKFEKNIVIDLNGKTLKQYLKKSINNIIDADVTFKNGSFITDSASGQSVQSTIGVNADSKLLFKDVKFESNASGIVPHGKDKEGAQKGSTVIIDHSTVKATIWPLSTNNLCGQDFDIQVINGSEIIADATDNDDTGLMINQKGKLTVKDSTIVGDRQVVIVRGGTAEFENVTLEMSSKFTGKWSNWGAGNEVPSGIFAIGNAGGDAYDVGSDVTLKGTIKIEYPTEFTDKIITLAGKTSTHPVTLTTTGATITINGTETAIDSIGMNIVGTNVKVNGTDKSPQ